MHVGYFLMFGVLILGCCSCCFVNFNFIGCVQLEAKNLIYSFIQDLEKVTSQNSNLFLGIYLCTYFPILLLSFIFSGEVLTNGEK